MKNSQEVFLKLPCLTELSPVIKAIDLKDSFKNLDRRYLSRTLQTFVDINIDSFNFLSISPFIFGSDSNLQLAFKTEKFIGTVPLKSPVNGKQIGDFVVVPRYVKGHDKYSDYIEILNLLDSTLEPDFLDSMPLLSGNNFKPPLYFEAAKFIINLYNLSKTKWVKFQNIEKKYRYPYSQVNWEKYIKDENNPTKKLIFPNKTNILTQLHEDYFRIKYVYEIAKEEIQSYRTPLNIKLQLSNFIQQLDRKLYYSDSLVTNSLRIVKNDSNIIRIVKIQANKILNKNFDIGRGWRLDMAEIFEKYVQYIFKQISKEMSCQIFLNYKFRKKTHKSFAWQLSHLEPDIIMLKEKVALFIDAKYKSNFYNLFSVSPTLKDDHRLDLHQILSYSSFSQLENRIGILCYPSDDVNHNEIIYENNINGIKNKVMFIGIPFSKVNLLHTKEYLLNIMRKILVM